MVKSVFAKLGDLETESSSAGTAVLDAPDSILVVGAHSDACHSQQCHTSSCVTQTNSCHTGNCHTSLRHGCRHDEPGQDL